MHENADDLPRHVPEPWGHELWFAHTERYAGKLIHLHAGHRVSLQYHHAKDETSYLLSGRLLLLEGRAADRLRRSRPPSSPLTAASLAARRIW